jgi:hypothetical protein
VTAATIEIVAEPPAYLLFARWAKVSIEIDGQLGRFGWGAHAFTVAAGRHTVAVGAGGGFASRAELEVELHDGESLRLRYTPRLIKNLRGKLVVERLPTARVVRG